MREALKKFYLKNYGEMNELVYNTKKPIRVELLNKFIELTVVNADEKEKDTESIFEQKLFRQKQTTYKSVEFHEVFSKKLHLILISGIAGVGKTWLLRKCLLEWVNGSLWENVDFVLYLECRKLNQYENVGSVNELLNVL